MKDNWNAYVTQNLSVNPRGSGSLNGLTFAVKDVFEFEGHKNTAGNPDWHRTHLSANKTAPTIEILLNNGACLNGMTHTDELMYSLNGENFFYGTPTNPSAEDRIPGGSSSGSAVAVAAGLADFALGTDTGGSVRIPSSYCGLFGLRPTHDAVSSAGVIPLAKSFDTVGWMTRSPKILNQVGNLLLPKNDSVQEDFLHVYFEEESWSFISEELKVTLEKAASLVNKKRKEVKLAEEGLSQWSDLFRNIQGIEIWEQHGEWIQQVSPKFGPGISERFRWTATLERNKLPDYHQKRNEIRETLSKLLKENGLLVIPTSPGEAPVVDLTPEESEVTRSRTMKLTCIAGLAGFPQVTIPIRSHNNLPIGLSFIANAGQDRKLLHWVEDYVNKLVASGLGDLVYYPSNNE